jgi:hypothetical protein
MRRHCLLLHCWFVGSIEPTNSVDEMKRAVWATSLGSEFDDFLFAPIRDDGNGMLLSVISALARLDLDPWQEAIKLAGLPEETATQRLTSLIAALPEGLSAHLAPRAIAARLIALLPRSATSDVTWRRTPHSADDVNKLRTGAYLFAVFFVITLAAQWIVASQQPPPQIDNESAPASDTVSPIIPPPNVVR